MENFLSNVYYKTEYKRIHRLFVRLSFTLTKYIKDKADFGISVCDSTDSLSDAEINNVNRLFELIEGAALRTHRLLRKLYDPVVGNTEYYDSELFETEHGREYVRKDIEQKFNSRTSARSLLGSILTTSEEAIDVLNEAIALGDDDQGRIIAAQICSHCFDRISTVASLLIEEEVRLLRTEKIPYRRFFLPDEIEELETHPNRYRSLFRIEAEDFLPINRMTDDELAEEFA